jgi:hypothetical protein
VSPEIRADVGVGNPGQLIIQKESKAFQFDLSAFYWTSGAMDMDVIKKGHRFSFWLFCRFLLTETSSIFMTA